MTSSTRIVRYAFCISIALLVLHPTCAFAQPTIDAALMKDMQALADHMHSEYLNPVLDNLRRSTRGDRELLELLNHVKLWTYATPRAQWGPNAIANYEDGRPIIHVDLRFINRMFTHAELAGLALTGRTEAAPFLEKAGYDYAQSLVQAMQKGLESPDFSFHIKDTVTDPVLRLAAKQLAYEAFSAGIAWIILHEVAHHSLGHTRVDPNIPVPLETSRKWELNADSQAFSMMIKLGYNLSPVRTMLGAMEVSQELRFLAGVEVLEIRSTHPSFATRRKELEKNHDTSKSTPGLYLAVLFAGADKKGYPFTTLICIPRPPHSEYQFLAVYQDSIQDGPVFMPFEWKNGQVHLYGRNPDMLSETIIHDPDQIYPNITFRYTPLPNGPVTEQKTRGFQCNFSSIHMADIAPGLKGYQALEFDPRTFLLQALGAVENRPDVLQTAERILDKTLQETKNIFFRYAQGKLSLEEANKQTLACSNKGSELLKTLLGPDKYARHSNLIFASPLMQFASKRMNTIQPFTQPQRAHTAKGNEDTPDTPTVSPSETSGRAMPSDNLKRRGASLSSAVVSDSPKFDLPSKARQQIEDPPRFWTTPSVVEQTGLNKVYLYAKCLRSDGSFAYLPYESTKWTSNDPNIASVNSKGVVEPNRPGTVTITAMANGLIAKARVKSTAWQWLGPNAVAIRENLVRIRAGETFTFHVKGPRDHQLNATPHSGDESIATATYHSPSRYTHLLNVTGKKPGVVTISFSSDYARVEVTK